MPINFPRLNFDWLGQIPENIEEARGRESLRSLGDLDITSAEGLDKAARQLFATKNLTNMQLALRLTQLAQNRRALESREKVLDPRLWSGVLSGIKRPEEPDLVPTPDTQEPELEPEIDAEGNVTIKGTGPRKAPAPAAPAPPTLSIPGMPAVPGPEIPGITGPAPGPAPAPRPGAALSPSEELLGQAQAAVEEPAGTPLSPTRLAQLGGEGGGGVPAPRPAQPGFGPREPVPYLPPPAPTPAPTAVPPRALSQIGDSRKAAREEAAQIEKIFPLMGLMDPGMRAVLSKRYENALRDADYTPEEKRYRSDQFQNMQAGRPVQTREDWALREKVGPKTFEEARKRYGVYRDIGDKARGLESTIDQAEILMKQPGFLSGAGTDTIAKVGGFLTNMSNLARMYGVPEQFIPSREWMAANITNPTAIAEAFRALSNRAIFQSLGGSLGNQVSNADRDFIAAAFPNLSLTSQGNKILFDMMREVAKRGQINEKIARAYTKDRKNRADEVEMDAVVQKYADKNPIFRNRDGTLTAAGQKVHDFLNQQPPPPTEVPGQGTPAPAPTQNRTKTGVDWRFE